MTAQSGSWSVGRQDTVNAILGRAVQHSPHKTYLHFLETDEKVTYAELDALTNRLAHGLLKLGVKTGDRIAMLFDSHLDAVALWFATNKCGAIFVPINTANKGEFLRNPLANSGAQIVFAESDYCERVKRIAHELPDVKLLVYRGTPPEGTYPIALRPLAGVYTANATPTGIGLEPAHPAGIIYTGGTTGPSKGCVLSHNYISNMSWGYKELCAMSDRDVSWTSLPLFHANALCTTILYAAVEGATAAISPRFSVSHFWRDVERSSASVVSVLGAMIPLIAHAAATPEMLRCVGKVRVAMGSPFTADLQKIWRERFGVQQAGANIYGLTEACYVTCLPFGSSAPPGSSGRRNERDFEVMIVDERSNEIPDGEGAGEILVRPCRPHVMFDGYWNRPEETLRVTRNLWFHSGDIGRFDKDGHFYFVDRKKDYLRRRGENISSYEMEATFLKHSAIREVAVHAVPSKLTEDDVKITVVLHEGSRITEEELARWAIDNVPYYAMPRYIELREALPKSPVGRVLKHQLRDEGCTDYTWDLEKSGLTYSKR